MPKKWIPYIILLLFFFWASPMHFEVKESVKAGLRANSAIDSLFKVEEYKALRAACEKELVLLKDSNASYCSYLNCFIGQSYFRNNTDSAIRYFEKAVNYAHASGAIDLIVTADIYLLCSYNRCLEVSTATRDKLYTEIKNLSERNISLKNKILILSGLADYYVVAGKEELWVSSLFKTASYSEQYAATGQSNGLDSNNLGIVYQNIGNYYYETNRALKAEEYYLLSRHWIRNYKRGVAVYYMCMMKTAFLKNDLNGARLYIDSLNLFAFNEKDEGVIDVTMRSGIELVNYYLSGKQLNTAWKYYYLAAKLTRENPDEITKGRMKLLLAKLLNQENKYKEALLQLKLVAQQAPHWPLYEYANYLKVVAECYTGLKRFNMANDQYRRYLVLADSLNNKNLRQSLAFAEGEYQIEKKQSEINHQRYVIGLVQKQKLWLISALVLVAFLMVLMFIFYRSKNKYAQILNIRNKDLIKVNGQLDEANKTKAMLFSILSHDLRAPISDVYELLKMRQWEEPMINSEEMELLEEEIRLGAGSLLEIMEDLLIWSKTQLDSIHTEIEDVDINKVFIQCQHLLQMNIQAKKIKLVNRLPQKCFVKTDPNFLETIIRNVLHNAINASPVNGKMEVGFCFIGENCRPCLWLGNSGTPFSQEHYLNALQQSSTSKNLKQGLGLKVIDELSRRINIDVRFDLIDEMDNCCSLLFKE